MKKIMTSFLLALTVIVTASCSNGDWRTASRESAGIAPLPHETPEAVIEVYAADAFGWRGWFAVHSWIAFKEADADEYSVYEVVGWGVDNGRSAVRRQQTTTPDRYWYGARPDLILSLRGDEAERLIPQIQDAIARYPWADQYKAVPGPNSNTFPAWIAIQVPELGLRLPFNAIGKGYARRDRDGS